MVEKKDNKKNGLKSSPPDKVYAQQWPGIDSSFRLIIVAALRTKQLLHGSAPRIQADPLKRRNTSIALEEVKRGLVPFTRFTKDAAGVKSVVS
jgi:DNA-directed RNA polymerase omega subunit